MANYFQDNDDLRYYIERGVDWGPLVELVERGFASPEGFKAVEEATQSYRDILETVGGFVADDVAPHAAEIERDGVGLRDGEVALPPRLSDLLAQLRELGVYGMTMPRELGGLGVPTLMYYFVTEILARGNVSVLTHFSFYGAVAEALLLYSVTEGSTTFDGATGKIERTRFADEIAEVIRGAACGSMDITEANAGSDMAAIKSRAEQDERGAWYVTGEKIFITCGHGKYHFVIARTENEQTAPGLKGLSLFMVPAYTGEGSERRRLARVERLEEKLGHHASPTCVVTFDRTPAQLIGKRGEGFGLMLQLMNGARIAVGFEGLGLCETAYRTSAAYAALRQSMGKTIDRHELIADYLDEMRTDIQVVRALAVHSAYHEEMAMRLEARLKYLTADGSLEAKRLQGRLRHHRHEARQATPLVKYLAAERAVEAARRAVQIHGGAGYTTEYGVERLLRDAVAMPIYEGTSQIQALMATKDALGAILRNPRAFFRQVAQARWRALSTRDGLERRVAKLVAQSLSAQQHLLSRTAADKLKALSHAPLTTWPHAFFKQWDPKRDFGYALLHAERLTKMLCDATAAEILWMQAQRHPERREVLARHLERAEPRVRFLLDEITTTGARLLIHLRHSAEERRPASRSA